jgi:hypothetical protein
MSEQKTSTMLGPLLIASGVLLVTIIGFPFYEYNIIVYAWHPQERQPLQQSLDVKITSPQPGQRFAIGNDLTIIGTSTDNNAIDCTVYAGWNGIQPYKKATATGPHGDNDYSTWSFTYTNDYHSIASGTNVLTAKISCLANATNLTRNYNIIIIGISSSPYINQFTTPLTDSSSDSSHRDYDDRLSKGNSILDNRGADTFTNTRPTSVNPDPDTSWTAKVNPYPDTSTTAFKLNHNPSSTGSASASDNSHTSTNAKLTSGSSDTSDKDHKDDKDNGDSNQGSPGGNSQDR